MGAGASGRKGRALKGINPFGMPGIQRPGETPDWWIKNKKNGRKRTSEFSIMAPSKLPVVTPHRDCQLKILKMHRISDWLILEEEYLQNIRKMDRKPNKMMFLDKKSIRDAKFLRGSPMIIANLDEVVDNTHAIITYMKVISWYSPIMSFVDKNHLRPNSAVLVNPRTWAIVGVDVENIDEKLALMKVSSAPDVDFSDIGGLETQIQEAKEAIELPLTKPELFEEMGIKPPKGVIFYGPPGTGKTLLAKAIASAVHATFIRITGADLVQKGLGDGPKMVRDLFKMAYDNAPSIIFVDEVDAIGIKRNDGAKEGELEVQRTLLELLNQLDGFDKQEDVKIIMATNRITALDPALIRPGRIDRKIEFPNLDAGTLEKVFEIQTRRMHLASDVSFKTIGVENEEEVTGADITAICTEAGIMALRQRRTQVLVDDFKQAKENVFLAKKQAKIKEEMFL